MKIPRQIERIRVAADKSPELNITSHFSSPTGEMSRFASVPCLFNFDLLLIRFFPFFFIYVPYIRKTRPWYRNSSNTKGYIKMVSLADRKEKEKKKEKLLLLSMHNANGSVFFPGLACLNRSMRATHANLIGCPREGR